VLDAFVSQDDVLDEFFIKNLEMVQGDERDRMIFSVGYGPAQDGTISTNFGPINKSSGERRLNVAVTRAKEHITVVCSMLPGDIDLSGSNSTGAKHFKNYLEYARKGEQALVRNDQVTDTLDFDSQFEEAVYDALEAEGYDVVSQVESSSYSIDLAIKHPEQPGKFILGVECDGAAYHSSKTARDRDRTRQMVLENLGWTIHRIWSPDWASNAEREIQKINEKIESLLAGGSISTEAEKVPSHEPEAIEFESKTDHAEITEYQLPDLDPNSRYAPNKQGHSTAVQNSLKDVVFQYGPITQETVFRTALNVWSESRLGKNVRQTFENSVEELKRSNEIFERDGFLWPAPEECDFVVRVNTETASRPIDEIPLEEIAKAASLILQEGEKLTRDDLELETTRLFGYQRRGQRIKDRIDTAVQLLAELDVVQEVDGKFDIDDHADVDQKLLQRIYSTKTPKSDSETSAQTNYRLTARDADTDNSSSSHSGKVHAEEVGGICPKCGNDEFRFKHEGETVTCINCGNNHLLSALDQI
jgi:very-short-patch-repair endonuclease